MLITYWSLQPRPVYKANEHAALDPDVFIRTYIEINFISTVEYILL